MSVIPCPNKIGCESDNPLTNYSSEAPDPRLFLGYSTGTAPTSSFTRNIGGSGPRDGGPDRDDTGDGPDGTAGTGTGGLPPPLGSTWDNAVITTFAQSEESQAQAHDDAGNDNVSNMASSSDDGSDTGGIMLWNNQRPTVYGNDPQTCSIVCPDGQLFSYTVAANRFRALSKAKANQSALAYACKQAQLNQVCLGSISLDATVDELYDQTIIAFAVNVPITFTVIVGDIPTWADATVDIDRVRLFGTPAIGDVGDTTFTMEAVDVFGNRMTRAYTITVTSGDACNPVASPAIESFALNIDQAVFCDLTETIFAIDGSTNESLFEINTSGTIINTILVGGQIGCVFYENTNQRIYIAYRVSAGVYRVVSYNPVTRAVINTVVLTDGGAGFTIQQPNRMTYDPVRNRIWTKDNSNYVWSLNANTFSQSVVVVNSGTGDFGADAGMVYCGNQDKVIILGTVAHTAPPGPNTFGISVWNPATMTYSYIDAGGDAAGGEICYNSNNGLAYGTNTVDFNNLDTQVLVIDPSNIAGFTTIDLPNTNTGLVFSACYNPCTDKVIALAQVAGVLNAFYINTSDNTIANTLNTASVATNNEMPMTYDAENARVWTSPGNVLLKLT